MSKAKLQGPPWLSYQRSVKKHRMQYTAVMKPQYTTHVCTPSICTLHPIVFDTPITARVHLQHEPSFSFDVIMLERKWSLLTL